MIDLHAHTTRSDGTDSPEQLLALARAAGLEAIAITDHDTLTETGDPIAIPAAEVSASGGVHILGYFFHGPKPSFRSWLVTGGLDFESRTRAIAARLHGLGCDVTAEEAIALGARSTCRPHFARLLVDKGYVSSFAEAFERYLGEGKPAWVERPDPPPEEVIEQLRAGGGLPSLAHPVHLVTSDKDRFITRLARAGLAALEVFHSDHSPADTQHFLALAERLGLGVTGGSDYHGGHKPGIRLGSGRDGNVSVPSTLLDDLRRRAADL